MNGVAYIVVLYVVFTTILSGVYLYERYMPVAIVQNSSEGAVLQASDTSLEKYSFPSLRETEFAPGRFRIEKEIQKNDEIVSYYVFLETPDGDVSGMLNVPARATESATLNSIDSTRAAQLEEQPRDAAPFVLLLRGFVDRSVYETGIGSQRIGEELAKQGYVTFSPDFLSYARSDKASDNPMEERFQGYTTALTALASVQNLNPVLAGLETTDVQIDPQKVGIWGHSNGGHIALSLAAITGEDIPTVLWAPVSKPFPYSILYYTDEYEDYGRGLRKLIATFEETYNVDNYSTNKFYDWIQAPIQIHQGMQDEPVPARWSQQLESDLKENEVEVELFLHENADHNLAPEGWAPAAAETVAFFNEQFSASEEADLN